MTIAGKGLKPSRGKRATALSSAALGTGDAKFEEFRDEKSIAARFQSERAAAEQEFADMADLIDAVALDEAPASAKGNVEK